MARRSPIPGAAREIRGRVGGRGNSGGDSNPAVSNTGAGPSTRLKGEGNRFSKVNFVRGFASGFVDFGSF